MKNGNTNALAMETLNSNNEQRIYMEYELDDRYKKVKPKTRKKEVFVNSVRRKFTCSASRIKKLIYSVFPILQWLPTYNVKQNIADDLSAGLTVGIVQIPQGMAYALLATLPPILGMYVSFFPVLIYPIFGTSRHLSIGTFAVVSILISGILDQQVPVSYCGDSEDVTQAAVRFGTEYMQNASRAYYGSTTTAVTADCAELYRNRKVEVAIALSFSVGLLQVLMNVFQMGVVTVLLSDSMLNGFVCGASYHVLTSQVDKFFGIQIQRHSGPLALIYTYYDIFRNITSINWGTTIISVICTILLVIGKEFNIRYRSKLPLAIPWELIIVIFCTIASFYGHLEENYGVVVVGEIPTGISTSVPNWSDVLGTMLDAIPLAIVAFAVEISLCQLFATKHAYKIDSNQELLALGMCNIAGAFFSCFPSASSLSRSAIYEEMGGRTQLGGIVTAVMVLTVLLWIGPLFENLPQAALAVIIIVNVKRLILMWRNVKSLWIVNKLDAIVWIVTWFAVIFLGVGMGLVVGTSFSILTVLFRTRSARGVQIRQVPHTDTYRNVDTYDTLPMRDKIFVFKFLGPLYYFNKDRFTHDLNCRLGFDPVAELARKRMAMQVKMKNNKKIAAGIKSDGSTRDVATSTNTLNRFDDDADSVEESDGSVSVKSHTKELVHSDTNLPSKYTHVIFDMNQCSFVDSDGANLLRGLYDAFDGLGIHLMLASCNGEVRRILCAVWKDRRPSEYVSVQSAVQFAENEYQDHKGRAIMATDSDDQDDDDE